MTGVALKEDEPLALVGDIHGEPDRLAKALLDLRSDGRRLVLLGDYINRGANSRAVLDLLVQAAGEMKSQLVLLRGNHEVALLHFLCTGDPGPFLRHRGASTILSYVPSPGASVLSDFRTAFPIPHERLLTSMPVFAEGPHLLATHSGYNPREPTSRSERDVTVGHWPQLLLQPQRRPPRPLVVFGHYTQRTGLPHDAGAIVGLDTGCGSSRSHPLTALLLPEREFRTY